MLKIDKTAEVLGSKAISVIGHGNKAPIQAKSRVAIGKIAIVSAHPQMAIFADFVVGRKF